MCLCIKFHIDNTNLLEILFFYCWLSCCRLLVFMCKYIKIVLSVSTLVSVFLNIYPDLFEIMLIWFSLTSTSCLSILLKLIVFFSPWNVFFFNLLLSSQNDQDLNNCACPSIKRNIKCAQHLSLWPDVEFFFFCVSMSILC